MLNAPVKSESKAESADVLKHVDDDRKMLIQAIIVRSVLSLSLAPRSSNRSAVVLSRRVSSEQAS